MKCHAQVCCSVKVGINLESEPELPSASFAKTPYTPCVFSVAVHTVAEQCPAAPSGILSQYEHIRPPEKPEAASEAYLHSPMSQILWRIEQ